MPVLRSLNSLDEHARAIWDNGQALSKERLASMYGLDASQTKDEMVTELVQRYLESRGDERKQTYNKTTMDGD